MESLDAELERLVQALLAEGATDPDPQMVVNPLAFERRLGHRQLEELCRREGGDAYQAVKRWLARRSGSRADV